MKEYNPEEDTRFYCSGCDSVIVDSSDKNTGQFYTQFGHMHDRHSRQYNGDYVGVMFAYCHNCNPYK